MEKKVLCIGDSLCLPGHLNKYEDTWFFKLKKEFPDFDFISFFKRQLTTEILVTMGGGKKGVDGWPKGADCLEAYLPHTIILQLGIVDCAPRLLYEFERKLVSRVPNLIKTNYLSLIKVLRKRNLGNTLVSFDKFKININNYIERAYNIGVSKIIIIGIAYPDEKMVDKNPQILQNVDKYNDFYKKISSENKMVEIILPLDAKKYDYRIYEDGYHPNKAGHELVKNRLAELLCHS
ncbi:hypothetical protein A8B79_10370 [Balneola sp. EhC07]|uniref:SGNH/GDSL hydrolase family protein n=1 Tax=Balneola sp. EhC07 TaxID=1849360 RepID=UPI0007F4A48D|nr:SGNH/GDSL hydrolase family protein [Balneola sp. EhC07]OAN60343.1 hypothetical protein A8B79_10370 [Balneola sp. EhC07]